MAVIAFALSLLLFFTPFVATQEAQTVQDDWVFPQLPDSSTVLKADQSYTLKWTLNLHNWFSAFCSDCDPTQVDFWITSLDKKELHKIASDVNVTSTLSLEWTATVPASELEDVNIWNFQFVPKDVVPSQDGGGIASPQFKLTDPNAASSTSTTVSPTTSSTSSDFPTSMTTPTSATSSDTGSSSTGLTTSTPSPTSTPEPQQNSGSGLSTGAKAGVGVGVSVGALGLIALGWVLASVTKKPSTAAMPQQQQMTSPPHNFAPPQQFSSPQNMGLTQPMAWQMPPQDGPKDFHEVHGTPAVSHSPYQPSSSPPGHAL